MKKGEKLWGSNMHFNDEKKDNSAYINVNEYEKSNHQRKEVMMMSKMRNPLGFFRELMKQPILVPIWVFVLMCVNVASIAFWSAPLAKVIFATFMVSAAMMMGLYSLFGFEKILGLGHVLWIPLLLYILTQLPSTEDGFSSYLIILSLSITVSLVFDTVDTWKYFSLKDGT